MMEGAQVHLADTCSLCNNTKHVNWFCNDCQESLCDRCKSIHERGKKTRNDDIVRMKEPNKQHEVIVSEMATGDSWVPQSFKDAKGTPLRVVLLGTTGAGKSATGNTLLGTKKFTSSPGRKSCTEECSVAEVDRFGRRLVVVDTPGVLDTGMHERDLKEILKECTQLACPGVHAFLFVMKIGERDIYTKDQKTFELFTELLSKEFLDHTIVVFTAKECLGEVPLDHFVSDLPDTCKAFIESCKGGYLAISNFSTDEKEEAEQVVEKVKGLVQKNDDRYYKNVLLDEQNKEIQKRMEVDLKRNDDIWKQITQTERGKQRLMTKHKVHGLTDDERKELTKLENIIFKLKEKIIQKKVVRINAIHGIQREQNMKQAIVVGVAVVGVGVGVGVAAAIASQAPVAGLVAVASEAVLTKRK